MALGDKKGWRLLMIQILIALGLRRFKLLILLNTTKWDLLNYTNEDLSKIKVFIILYDSIILFKKTLDVDDIMSHDLILYHIVDIAHIDDSMISGPKLRKFQYLMPWFRFRSFYSYKWYNDLESELDSLHVSHTFQTWYSPEWPYKSQLPWMLNVNFSRYNTIGINQT